MSHLGADDVRARFAGMVKRCADCGFDLAGGRVEVVPTAHYMMGGVVCDIDTRTALPGLYVAGEDAGGAHGANRLGGNGVANSTVFGGIAGDVMGPVAAAGALREPDEALIDAEISRARHPFTKQPGDVGALRDRLMDAMWDDVGVLRTAAGLSRALTTLADIGAELMETGLADDNIVFNLTWHDWLNLRSLVEVSEAITRAALARENSRGAHFREDFPDQGDLATSTYTLVRREGAGLTVDQQPVDFTIVRPGESLIDEEEAIA
jgi:fumarate reductase flavoprotein subunit